MSAYWDQWSHAELMSMQGVEIDEDLDHDDIDLCLDKHDIDSRRNEEHEISLDSLGLSWRDFM